MKITKRQFNLIVENYLMTEMKAGTAEFEFKNSCDMSDIEFTKGYKAFMAFRKDKKIQETNKKIREIEASINNPNIDPTTAGPGAVDDFVSGKITELAEAKEEFAKLSKAKLGPFGFESFAGITSPVFQNQLLKVLGFGMLVTMGPAANLYCDMIRSIVTVLNKSIDAMYGADRRNEKEETIEFDFFYNALNAVSSPVLSRLANDKQEATWRVATKTLNISPNAMSLFKYIYCMTGKYIDVTSVPSGRTDAGYNDEIKNSARKFIREVGAGDFERNGKNAGGPSLKSDFKSILGSNPDREDLIQGLVGFIDRRGYGAQGTVSRSNFADLNRTIATKSAEEKDFYDNLLGHIKGTLNSVPG